MPLSDNIQPVERPRAEKRIDYVLLTLSLLWCVYWFVHSWHYLEDDAWIHLEFARSVAAGKGFAFNGRVVAGDTAPLWVLLLDAAHLFIRNWIVAGKVLTILGAVFGFAGIYGFARRLAAQMLPSAGVFPAAIILLMAVNPYTCYWIFSGMETVAAAGLACFAVLAATRKQPTATSFWMGCLLAGLGPLLRPEMIFLTALLLLPLWGQYKQLRARHLFVLLAGCMLLAAPLALWSAYCLHAFGHVLPNTNAAKRAGLNQSVLKRLAVVYVVGFPIIVCGIVCAVAAVLARASAVGKSVRDAFFAAVKPTSVTNTRRNALPPAGWIFIGWFILATIFYIVNHTYVQTRYIFVPAPGVTIIVLVQLLRSSRNAGRVVYVLGLLSAICVSVVVVRPFIRNKGMLCDDMAAFAAYIRDAVPPDAPVAIYAIGQVAFISQHPIIDTGGITRPEVLTYLKQHPHGAAQWAASVGAIYYVDAYSPIVGMTPVYSAQVPYIGWTFHTSEYARTYPFVMWKLPSQNATPANTP
jgi:hypothetical protein